MAVTSCLACLLGLVLSGQVAPPPLSPQTPKESQAAHDVPPAEQAAPAPDLADETLFASPTRLDHIGRIVVPVMVNSQGPFRFIVDTGASHSTASPELAKTLGLALSSDSSLEVNGITGTAQVPYVSIDKLQAGDVTIENTRFPVLWAPVMAGADGILGIAGLSGQRLLVDFQRNRVTISQSKHSDTPRGFVRIPAVRLTGGLLAIEARVGGVRVDAIIDTGSSRTLGNLALQNAVSARQHSEVVPNETRVYGATTDIASGDLQTAPIIVIGKLKITDLTLVYGDFHIFKVWRLQDKPALIVGMDVLGTVDGLGIDFRHPSVYFQGAGIRDSDHTSVIPQSAKPQRP